MLRIACLARHVRRRGLMGKPPARQKTCLRKWVGFVSQEFVPNFFRYQTPVKQEDAHLPDFCVTQDLIE